jgi:hypothetical protein
MQFDEISTGSPRARRPNRAGYGDDQDHCLNETATVLHRTALLLLVPAAF